MKTSCLSRIGSSSNLQNIGSLAKENANNSTLPLLLGCTRVSNEEPLTSNIVKAIAKIVTNTHLTEEALKNTHALNPEPMKGFEKSKSDKDIPAFVPPPPPPMPTLENNSIKQDTHSHQQKQKLTGMDAVIAELNKWFESNKNGNSDKIEGVSSSISPSPPPIPKSNSSLPVNQVYLQGQNLTCRNALLAELKEKLKIMFGSMEEEDAVDSAPSVKSPPPMLEAKFNSIELATDINSQAKSLAGREALLAELKEKLKIMFGSIEEDTIDSTPSVKSPPPMPEAKFNSIELATDINSQAKSLVGREALLAELKEKLKTIFGNMLVEDDVNREPSFIPPVPPPLPDFDGTVKTMN